MVIRYMSMDTTQIKSSIGNSGNFHKKKDDLTENGK